MSHNLINIPSQTVERIKFRKALKKPFQIVFLPIKYPNWCIWNEQDRATINV